MSKFKNTIGFAAVSALLLNGCAMAPMGPTITVMPAPGKPFDAFAADQAMCKQFASQETAGQADAVNNQAVGTAIISTALGAGLGAALGGGRGAGVGAASGAIVGTSVGADVAQGAQGTIQQQYDNAYAQCMYAKGNQVPGFAPAAYTLPPPAAGSPAPPPAGSPPSSPSEE